MQIGEKASRIEKQCGVAASSAGENENAKRRRKSKKASRKIMYENNHKQYGIS